MSSSAVPAVILNNGVEIPQLGFGVYQIPLRQTRETTLEALAAGYRHIDTAEAYGNEGGVGEAVRESGIDRSQIFVTSKLTRRGHGHDEALRAFDRTMEDLGLEYLDLFLIHWPLPTDGNFVATWSAMEEMHASGRVKAIGVSNFDEADLNRLMEANPTVPAVNQIEVHPYRPQDPLRAFGAEHGIATVAYSPIAQGGVLDDPVITEVAARVGRSAAQVTLRWHVQRGDIVIPKSVTPSRIAENIALFDFELTEDDMRAITALGRS